MLDPWGSLNAYATLLEYGAIAALVTVVLVVVAVIALLKRIERLAHQVAKANTMLAALAARESAREHRVQAPAGLSTGA